MHCVRTVVGLWALSGCGAPPQDCVTCEAPEVVVVHDTAQPPIVIPEATPGFVGFSTLEVTGDAGWYALELACNAVHTFSHICTDEMLMSTGTPDPEGPAWVVFTVASTYVAASGGVVYVNPFGVEIAGTAPNCDGFWDGDDLDAGLAWTGSRFETWDCGVPAVVACCSADSE